MELILEKTSYSAMNADLLVIGIFQEETLEDALKRDANFPPDFLSEIEELCKLENFKAKSKETISLFTQKKIAARRLVLVGLGKRNDFSASVVRKTAATFARQFASKAGYPHVALDLSFDSKANLIQAAVEGWKLGSYSFLVYKTQNENGNNESGDKTKRLSLIDAHISDAAFEKACMRGRAIAEATCFARDLIAEPACNMTPSKLAQVADSLTCDHVTCEILEAEDVARLGMGAYLGVAQGSEQPPKFIALKYTHPDANRFFAIVGKGITFDSGGLSLKPAASMETMKYDMAGAAAVLGVIRALLDLKAPVSVLAVVPACENMPSGRATRPGDILVAMNGKTIEVNNTDAEGRLTLADALCYVGQQKPEAIIDIATLTGAVVTALGKSVAGIMGNDMMLVGKIIDSAMNAGEKMWQLPLFDEYKDTLKSDIADLKNAGARGEAGSSSAGMFLKEFVDNIPWAHLDIAGPGWMDKDKEELNKGGTGYGVRALSYFLLDQIENESVGPR